MQRARVTLVPIVLAIAAFFVVLPRTGGNATLRMTGQADTYAFEPAELELPARGAVRVVNETSVTHTVTSISEGFDLVLQPGQSGILERIRDGTYEFFCRFHGATTQMAGTILVGDAGIPSGGGDQRNDEPDGADQAG